MIANRPAGGSAGELSEELIRQARLLHGLRAHLGSWTTAAGFDWAAFLLLANLIRSGPQRQGELAGCAMLDPSTVSRHVGQLVRAGYVERRPDPLDGRAVQLVPTAAGREVFERVEQRRNGVLCAILSGWGDDDVGTLVTLLRRLNHAFETYRPAPPATGPETSGARDGLPSIPEQSTTITIPTTETSASAH